MSPTDPTEVQKIIKSMKPKKSSGHDNLSGKLIKAISKEICTPLSIVINMSLESGVLSDSTKLAKVIPIYKTKNCKLFENHRLVSLFPVLSKIFEKKLFMSEYFPGSLQDI